MKTRDVLIVAAIVIGCAVVISLRTDEERAEPGAIDTASSAEHQQRLTPHAEKGAIAKPDSQLAEGDDARESAKPAPPALPPTEGRRRQVLVGKRRHEPPGRQFNERVLIDLDYSPRTIRFIRDLWERSSADEDARAERSDQHEWAPDDPRNRESRDTLRSDLGDDLYDAMLYATNQANRAIIGNVIGTSPAAAAGLRIRDAVVRYDGERVFDPDEAKRLSESTEPGRVIEVWIQREGEDIQMYVQGGPLGVRYFPAWTTPALE